MKKNEELSIIIYSCKKNSDMWIIFSELFKKYWYNCDYKIYLVTDQYIENKELVFDQVIEYDSDWGNMIIKALNVADTQYVMLWMDDYLLCDYVNNHDIEEKLRLAVKYNVANLRLMESPSIKSAQFKDNLSLGYYKPGTAYSLSTQVGIWNSEFLLKNINEGWSAWEFEKKGSITIKDYEHPLLATLDYTFPYEEGVRRGKWMDNGVRLCKRNGINLDFNKRKKMNSLEHAWIYFKGAILELNPTLVVKLQNFFKL